MNYRDSDAELDRKRDLAIKFKEAINNFSNLSMEEQKKELEELKIFCEKIKRKFKK